MFINHSLGGVACIDLLIQQMLPQTQALATAGSQAPCFYKINAMHSISWKETLIGYFPSDWLNLYDLRDFLSYIGSHLFPERVKDVLVDNKQPYPYALNAYDINQPTW